MIRELFVYELQASCRDQADSFSIFSSCFDRRSSPLHATQNPGVTRMRNMVHIMRVGVCESLCVILCIKAHVVMLSHIGPMTCATPARMVGGASRSARDDRCEGQEPRWSAGHAGAWHRQDPGPSRAERRPSTVSAWDTVWRFASVSSMSQWGFSGSRRGVGPTCRIDRNTNVFPVLRQPAAACTWANRLRVVQRGSVRPKFGRRRVWRSCRISPAGWGGSRAAHMAGPWGGSTR